MPSSPQPFRIGHGYDLHRLQPGGKLVLAGVTVSTEISPIAHSDGDVVIHAIVDAILGAMAWGDIGELFANDDPQWRNAASSVFLESVWKRVRDARMVLGNLDITILAERPRLKPYKEQMAVEMSRMLEAHRTQVNIKAGTNEQCDAIGRGEAIAAHAVVMLVPDSEIGI